MRLLAALAPRSPRSRCGLSRRLDRLDRLSRLDRFLRFHGVALGGLTAIEKNLPWGRRLSRPVGALLILAAVYAIAA